jgi:hypothetical protein
VHRAFGDLTLATARNPRALLCENTIPGHDLRSLRDAPERITRQEMLPMSQPPYPPSAPHGRFQQPYGQPLHRPDTLTPEERAAADAAVARMRAERDVAEAEARGRAAGDPHGLVHRPDLGYSAHPHVRPTPRPASPRNGLGLAALILALIGVLFGLVPLTGFIAVALALVAVPLALAGRARVRRGEATNGKSAMTGLVVGLGALALGVWGITIVFGAVDQLADDLSGPAPLSAPAVSGQQPAAEAPAASTTAAFGERVTFDDGVVVEVTAPQPYKPSRYAAGHDRDRAVKFDVTVTNGSDEPLEAVTVMTSATHGGRQVSPIYDSANGGSENPAGTILPGKSMTFSVALSLAKDPAELQVEVRPGFIGEPAIFTGNV